MTDQISYRVGRSWGVTVVRETPGQPDQLVGTMQRAEDAQLIVDTLNESNRELCEYIVANQQLAKKLALAEEERDGLRAQLRDAEEYISDLECALSGDAS